MSNKKKLLPENRRVAQRGHGHGRHREPSRTVGDLLAVPGMAGVKVLAAGALGSAAVLSMSGGAASAATAASPVTASLAADVQPVPATALPATAATTSSEAAVPAAPALATGTVSIGPAVADPIAFLPRPVVKVAIVGDSYTSGEGNNNSTYATNAAGDIMPQHQSNMSPAMQALQQIIDANPQIDFQVSNVAVSGATRPSAFSPSEPGTVNEQPPQIAAVQNADLVINGFGGNDAGFPPGPVPC
jgi:lysophospholipase L1-like esterase